MYFADALTLDAPRRTSAGYLAVRARSAKTGVYQYTGREVDPNNEHGLRDQASVNVLRDEATVFNETAARTFIGKPITIDHPSVPVTSKNWKDHARGTVMGALRDGDHLAFDLLLMDAAAIADVDAGKVQVSNGYSASLEFGDFASPDGIKCPVRQARISDGNHVAIVDRARGGDTCRVADAAHCDRAPQSFLDSLTTQEKPVKTMLIDGLTVDIANADTAEATIKTLLAARDASATKVTNAEAAVATHVTTIAAKDAEIVTLKQQVTDAKVTPQQMRDAAKAYATTVDQAKKLAATATITDAMDEAAIKRLVVDTKLADAAKGWTDEQVAVSFATMAAGLADSGNAPHNSISGSPVNLGDADKVATDARAAMIADMLNPTVKTAA